MQDRILNEVQEPSKLGNQNHFVVQYLKHKCGLPQQQIRQKLLKGQTFDIRGEGTQVDRNLIQDVLIENDFYEKPAQKQLKDDAMRFVKTAVEEWSLAIAKQQRKINKQELPNYTAKVLAFGSHVLDLRSNSSDIDLVCVVPNFVDRDHHFFQILAKRLQLDPQVKGLNCIKKARVPIITFDYKQINIDISYCKLEEQTIPRDIERILNMDKINKITDEKSKTSIMGRKNNLMILELAGANQIQNFKQTLRIIKVWAKNRGISSNSMGYLGGISWAIMLAKICQIFPHHKPSKLLSQFFHVYKLWIWKQMPVTLIQLPKELINLQQSPSVMMTVLTPGNHYNSTERVNKILFQVIQREIARASEILHGVRGDYRIFCEKIDFIGSHDFFIEIDVCGTNKTREQQKDYKDFLGHVESRILNLLNLIIMYNKKDLERSLKIVPFPKSFKKTDPIYDLCYSFFLGVTLSAKADLSRAVSEWCINLDKERAGKQQHLNVRVFECKKEEFLTDVQVVQQAPKKLQKQDPRLAKKQKI